VKAFGLHFNRRGFRFIAAAISFVAPDFKSVGVRNAQLDVDGLHGCSLLTGVSWELVS
jgi:hypothetical protein